MRTILTSAFLLIMSLTSFAQGYRVNRTEEKKKVNIRNGELGKNIISFTPVQIIANDIFNENPDLTIGLSYERIFNNEMISFRLPVSVSIEKKAYYFMPTIKLYPKKQGLVKYAIGPQFLFATREETYSSYVTGSGGVVYEKLVTDTRSQLGFLINNSVNFTFSKALYLALDFSLGLKYFDSMPNRNNFTGISPFGGNGNNSVSQTFQLNFNMGYRF